MSENLIKIAPNTVAYPDEKCLKLVVEFAIPGAPTATIDLKVLEDSIHLTRPKPPTSTASSASKCLSRTPWRMP